MPKQIDPLNKKRYGAVTVMLNVADVKPPRVLSESVRVRSSRRDEWTRR